jgi:hypothetical protein
VVRWPGVPIWRELCFQNSTAQDKAPPTMATSNKRSTFSYYKHKIRLMEGTSLGPVPGGAQQGAVAE